MEEKNKKNINRRDFIKIVGISAATSTAILYGCSSKGTSSSNSVSGEGEIPTDKMTYRTSPTTGDRVSLLGYGCMRWPLKPSPDGNGEVIDQDAVNGLVDYAIAHGVNYFDTSPAYVQGFSEKATGIALSRHPRDKYFIATKLSNFSPDTWSREASLRMYHKSFTELQVDYIDYMLLHGIGMGGMDALKGRYLDNGMLDFLIKEREAGRIRNLGFSYHGDIEVYDYLLSRHDEIKWDFVQIQLNYVDWKHAKETNTRNTDAEYLYGELAKRGIPSIIMEPLLGGRLANLSEHVAEVFSKDKTSVEHALDFLWDKKEVSLLLSGMGTEQQVEDNLVYAGRSAVGMLTAEEKKQYEKAKEIYDKMSMVDCTGCAYCMPCPFGLNIPELFKAYNTYGPEGKDGMKREYEKQQVRSDSCRNCHRCEKVCPQNIKISEQMKKIAELMK